MPAARGVRVALWSLVACAAIASEGGGAVRVGFDLFFPGGSGGAPMGRLMGAAGVTQVSLVTTRFQEYLNSTALLPSSQDPPLASLAAVVGALRATMPNATIWLKPHVDCFCGTWRAYIGTGFSDSDWQTWFANYTAYISEAAALAQTLELDGMVIGTEMVTATSTRPDLWRSDVIPAARAAFGGKLVYAANWGFEAWNVSFFDALDYVGVDAYYPLATVPDPPLQTLLANWAPVVANMSALAAQWQKPLIFTEVGYRSVSTAAEEPGVWEGGQPADLAAQSNLYSAILQAVLGWDGVTPGKLNPPPWLAAVQLWSVDLDPFQGGACDNGYTPINKPAFSIMATALGGHAPPPSSAFVARTTAASSEPVYANGTFASGWENWSYFGTFDPVSPASPPPGEAYSFQALQVQPGGAISLYTASAIPLSTAPQGGNITFRVRVAAGDPSAAVNLGVFLCGDRDCDQSFGFPMRILNNYLASQTCNLSTTWTAPAAYAVVPLSALLPSTSSGDPNASVSLQRLSIANAGASGVNATWFIDDVAINVL
jgi:hypothetical protein